MIYEEAAHNGGKTRSRDTRLNLSVTMPNSHGVCSLHEWRMAEVSIPRPVRVRSAFEAVPVPDRFTIHDLFISVHASLTKFRVVLIAHQGKVIRKISLSIPRLTSF